MFFKTSVWNCRNRVTDFHIYFTQIHPLLTFYHFLSLSLYTHWLFWWNNFSQLQTLGPWLLNLECDSPKNKDICLHHPSTMITFRIFNINAIVLSNTEHIFKFHQLSWNVPFSNFSAPEFNPGSHIVSGCLVTSFPFSLHQLSLAWPLLSLMLTVLKSTGPFCKLSLNLGLLDVFLGLDSAEHLGFASLLLSVTALSFYESYLSQLGPFHGWTDWAVLSESFGRVRIRLIREALDKPAITAQLPAFLPLSCSHPVSSGFS